MKLTIILNICFIIVIYLVVKYRYHRRFTRMIRDVTEKTERLFSDETLDDGRIEQEIMPKAPRKRISRFISEYAFSLPLYTALVKIRKQLIERKHFDESIKGIINSVVVNIEFEKVMDDLIPKLIRITNSSCCAFYSFNVVTKKFEIKHSKGFSRNIYSEFDVSIGEGLMGVSVLDNKISVINDIPDDTIYYQRTFLGKLKPRSIMIVPIFNNEELAGVLVMTSIHDYTEADVQLMDHLKYYVGIAVNNGLTYEKTKRLGNELKFQNTLIQNLNDELEKKMESRSLYLTNIINSFQDCAIYAMDKNGIIMLWNKGASELLGFSECEVIGKYIGYVYEPHEADMIKQRIDRVITDGRYSENGWRVKKDGTRFYYDLQLFCIYNDKHEIVGISNITRDITTIKDAELALMFERGLSQKIMESSSRILIITDEKGTIILSNHNADILFEQEQMTGRSLFEFFEDAYKLKTEFLHLVKTSHYSQMRCRIRDEEDFITMEINVMDDEQSENKKVFINLVKM